MYLWHDSLKSQVQARADLVHVESHLADQRDAVSGRASVRQSLQVQWEEEAQAIRSNGQLISPILKSAMIHISKCLRHPLSRSFPRATQKPRDGKSETAKRNEFSEEASLIGRCGTSLAFVQCRQGRTPTSLPSTAP